MNFGKNFVNVCDLWSEKLQNVVFTTLFLSKNFISKILGGKSLSNATYLDNLLLARVMVDRESIPLVGCKQKPELLACKSLKLAILGSSRSRVHRRCHLRRSHLASQGCNWARASCRHSWSHHSPFKRENESKILFDVFLRNTENTGTWI